MRTRLIIQFAFLAISTLTYGQSFTSYFTGNVVDQITAPKGGVCLMGGASEDDNAMIWFLQQSGGGDILVLRASGSDGYNDYLYSELGVAVNSVETIVFNDASAAFDPYVHIRIQQAEAIWMAGGNQWNYVSYWRDTPVGSLINEAIANRNIVVGGTSAGMAIQGGYYFSAENGTVTSSEALSNPYHPNITVDSTLFLSNEYLSDVITDTHYDDPDRKGRHLTFLSRILVDYGIPAKGIACDEYTAVCIDQNGTAKVYGAYPEYEDLAYFIQTNCEADNVLPENCTENNPLDWNIEGEAIKVYKVFGTENGSNTFNLNDWKMGSGGVWENWHVDNGVLNEQAGQQPDCNTTSIANLNSASEFKIMPNPTSGEININFENSGTDIKNLRLLDSFGKMVIFIKDFNGEEIKMNTSHLSSGIYFLEIIYSDNRSAIKKVVLK